jgi:hypothetical protein
MWLLLKDLLLPKYLIEVDGQGIMARNYVFVLMDHYQRAIVRIVLMRELVKEVIADAKAKNYVLAVQPQKDVDIINTLADQNVCTLFCVLVNQYSHNIGEPFLVFVLKNNTKDEVRQRIIFKLLDMRVLYEYGRDPLTKKPIMRELSEEQKANLILNYVDYKTSRRTIIYSDYTLRELAKDDTFLDYKVGSNTLNIGVEFQIAYLEDEQRRGNGGNALKIYSNQPSDNAATN